MRKSPQPVWAEVQTKVKSNNYLSETITNGCKGCRCCFCHDHVWASYIALELLRLKAFHNGSERAVSSWRSFVHSACRVQPCNGQLNSRSVCVGSHLLTQLVLEAWQKVLAAGELPWARNNGGESCRLCPTPSDEPNLCEHSNSCSHWVMHSVYLQWWHVKRLALVWFICVHQAIVVSIIGSSAGACGSYVNFATFLATPATQSALPQGPDTMLCSQSGKLTAPCLLTFLTYFPVTHSLCCCCCQHSTVAFWAALYNTLLLIKLTPKAAAFSFLLLHICVVGRLSNSPISNEKVDRYIILATLWCSCYVLM